MLRHCLRSINRNFRPKIYQKPWILFRAIRPVKCLGASAGTFLGFVLFSAAAKSYEEQDSSETLNLNDYYKGTALGRRFLAFASLSYNSEPFMTGDDFIAAVSSAQHANDPERFETLTTEEYNMMIERGKSIHLDQDNFLRNPDYIISYSEFLFLLSVIVKPVDQFFRHFQILDQSHSNSLTKEEFMSIESLATGSVITITDTAKTSMQMLLFGEDQKQEVVFELFSKFLHGIQRQCLKAEFDAFSEGEDFITDDEFMRLLLRRTFIPDIRKARYIDRLESRPEEKRKKILFPQYCQFTNLMNDFPDFEVAIRMFAITKRPLTKKDFQRAVKASTGSEFDEELVDVIFDVFDEDNDNKLGHGEFMEVMKDSIKSRTTLSYPSVAGENSSSASSPWEGYLNCVRQNMYKSHR